MRVDYHVHTEFSDDSDYAMEQVIKDAITMKLDEICFTDHVDYGVKKDWDEPGGMIYRKGGGGEPDKMPVANVDYPVYDKAGTYPFEKLKPLLTEILRTVIADGKGIEINTSSQRYGLTDLTPSRDILKLYRELGGRILTIGSDSHKPEHLGAYIDETKQELKMLGFKEFCTFDKMKPVYHPL